MDLLTPAGTWARHEEDDRDAGIEAGQARPHRMPLLQQGIMFVSVVGPIAGLVAAIVMLWNRDGGFHVGPVEVFAMLAMYALTAYGVTIGYHRLLTHRAFETYRPIKLMLAVFASMGGQGACIRWCATHRRHHQAADLEGDPHSPHVHGDGMLDMFRGMWHAHMGWLFHRDVPNSAKSVRDLLADPILMLIDKLYFPILIVGILIPGAIIGLWTQSRYGFWSGVVWGGLVRVCLLQHVTWSINSVCHVWGTRPFNSSDHSTNNLIFAILAMGEGWHNNHHAFPTSARHGLRWWQFDSSWVIIFLMSTIGVAWNVRVPSEAAMEAKSVKRVVA